MGHDLANGTHVELVKDQPHKFPKTRAVWAASGKKGLGAEIGPNPGASSTTPDDGEDHCPTRGSPAAPGGSQLDPVHGGRRARHHTTTDADDCDVEEILHAEPMLWLSKAKLLSTEPLAWHYVKWNQDKQCHEPTEAAPLYPM